MHSKMEETELSAFNEDGMRVHSQYVFSFLKVKSMDEDKVR